MASKTPPGIFSPVLSDIGPAANLGGAGLVQAAQTQASGTQAKAAADAGLLTFAGNQAISAYKGKLDADFENKVKDSLDKLEGASPGAIKSASNLDYLKSNEFAANSSLQIEQLNQQTKEFGADDPTVKDFRQDIDRFATAQAQGVLSKQDVLNRIAAAVKEYTAKAPGWGSSFRQIAAEMTGVSNIDVYNIHKALTEQSASEKHAELVYKADLKFTQDVGDRYGVPVEQVTPQMKLQYGQDKQLQATAENVERKMQIATNTDKEKDQYFGQYAAAKQLQGISHINAAFDKFREQNAGLDIKSKEAQTQLGGQVLGMLNDIEAALTTDFRSKGVLGPNNPNPTSFDTTEKYIKSTKEFLKTYKDNLQNENGWNAFTLSVTAAEGDYNKMMNNLMVANPYVAKLVRGGAMPDITKLYLTFNGDKDKVAASVGMPAAEAVDSFFKTGNQGATILSNSDKHPDAASAVEAVGKEGAQVMLLNSQTSIASYSKKPELNQGEQTDAVKQIKTLSNLTSPTDAGAMDRLNKSIATGELVAVAGKLTDTQKVEAFTPMRQKAKDSAIMVLKRIDDLTRASGSTIVLDPATGTFKANVPYRGITGLDSAELQKQVTNINNMGTLLNQINSILPKEAGDISQETLATLYQNYTEDSINKLKLEKEGVQSQYEDRKKQGNRGRGDAAGDQIFNERIKKIDEQIKQKQKGLVVAGAVVSKANPDAVPKNDDTPLTPREKAEKKAMTGGDTVSDVDDVDTILQGLSPSGEPTDTVTKAQQLESKIKEITDAGDSKQGKKELRPEDMKLMQSMKRKAQLALIDLKSSMSKDELSQFYMRQYGITGEE